MRRATFETGLIYLYKFDRRNVVRERERECVLTDIVERFLRAFLHAKRGVY